MHRLKAKSAKKYILNNNYHNNLRYRKIITRFYANHIFKLNGNIFLKCYVKYQIFILNTNVYQSIDII